MEETFKENVLFWTAAGLLIAAVIMFITGSCVQSRRDRLMKEYAQWELEYGDAYRAQEEAKAKAALQRKVRVGAQQEEFSQPTSTTGLVKTEGQYGGAKK